ncbi:hypothetical protein IEO21_09507 [Rhodonia placenta]|uniref:Polyketide synthase-like phosphopantetheine-binding domain-containing protein n=1 Tax=Rhodonia placenta TaxID=104341 RepID=A0A8H7NU95_9APHY|nr:hypothetical protein IEO21_09507 [Postia placenta]
MQQMTVLGTILCADMEDTSRTDDYRRLYFPLGCAKWWYPPAACSFGYSIPLAAPNGTFHKHDRNNTFQAHDEIHGQSSTTFRPPPLDGLLLIPELWEWHARYSPDHPLFVFADEGGIVRRLCWPEVVRAIHTGAKIIRNRTNWKAGTAESPTVAILANSDSISYATTLMAIIRAEYTGFLISTRNSPAAIAHLLNIVGVQHLLIGREPLVCELATKSLNILRARYPCAHVPETSLALIFEELYLPNSETVSADDVPYERQKLEDPIIILHTSGSTAFPKPITLTHRRAIEIIITPCFVHVLPMFHIMGMFFTMSAVSCGFIVSMFAPRSPAPVPTSDNIVDSFKATQCDLIFTVPSMIEVWSHNPDYIKLFATRMGIAFGGGPLNKEVGDSLTARGVTLFTLYGATETGAACMVFVANVGGSWDYFRFPPHMTAKMVPSGEGTFELVIVPGYWKVIGRTDDQIMHSTGEKTNPGPLESIMNTDRHVRASVMFGRGRFQVGILIEPQPGFVLDPSDEGSLTSFRNKIWPTVEKMNTYAPQHSRLFKEMILVANPSKPFLYTSKNTVRRGAVIMEYEDDIDALYDAVDLSAQTSVTSPHEWSLTTAIDYVRLVVHKVIAHSVMDDDDIFQHGCDSLQATYIRNIILGALRDTTKVNTRKISDSFVYDHPTISRLAAFVSSVALGTHDAAAMGVNPSARILAMRAMLAKCSADFPARPHTLLPSQPKRDAVFVTGTTGSIGCHLLALLVADPKVWRVYAFNRPAKTQTHLRERQKSALVERGLDASIADSEKVVLLEGSLTAENWGVGKNAYEELHRSVTHIIHNAWRVDFVIKLESFEDSIADSPCDVKFAEGPSEPDLAVGTGYAESKWVSEQILYAAAYKASLNALVVRVGQVCGGLNGAWNAHEWFPTLVQSTLELGCFPDDDKGVNWIPLEIAAGAIADFRHAANPTHTVHLVHPHPVSWHSLATVVSSELSVPLVAYSAWLAKLEHTTQTHEHTGHGSTQIARSLRALQLLPFFRGITEKLGATRMSMGLPDLEVKQAMAGSPTLRAPDLRQLGGEDVERWLAYWRTWRLPEGTEGVAPISGVDLLSDAKEILCTLAGRTRSTLCSSARSMSAARGGEEWFVGFVQKFVAQRRGARKTKARLGLPPLRVLGLRAEAGNHSNGSAAASCTYMQIEEKRTLNKATAEANLGYSSGPQGNDPFSARHATCVRFRHVNYQDERGQDDGGSHFQHPAADSTQQKAQKSMLNSRLPRGSQPDYDGELPRTNGLHQNKPPFTRLTRRHFRFAVIALLVIAAVPLVLRLHAPLRRRFAGPAEPMGADAQEDTSEKPPLYGEWHQYEQDISRRQHFPPNAKYLFTSTHTRGAGWGNAMQELIMHSYLAYRSGRTFTWYNYTWNDDGSDYTLYNGKHIPSRIPMSALLGGPIVGEPYHTDPTAPQPASISEQYYREICTESERRKIDNGDIVAQLGGGYSATALLDKWVEVMAETDARCVEIPYESVPLFDFWIMGDAGRLLNAWDGLAASPVLREFRWSPLVELAFDTNRETISPAQISAPYLTSLPADLGPRANPSATRYAPLPGLLAMHIRRGDFAGHCEHLGRWSSPWVGFNSFAALPDVLDTGRLPSDEAARIELYRTHCFPNIAEIVVRAEALRVAEAEGGRGELRDVYVMTNGPVEWVAELEAALKETGHWRHVASSRDLLVNQEQKYVKQAVDMLIGQRAQVFVGNGWSSLTGLVSMLRMGNGINPKQTRML